MCIIYERQPNIEIPFEKFENSILNNPHGYGLSFEDDGKLTVLRSKDKPDVDTLYRLVQEELSDKQVLLHLRYNTAGETNLRNAHPFPVLEKRKHGVDLRVAHNGTIHKYKPAANSNLKDQSDTRRFVIEYLRPLFSRLVRGNDIEDVLKDEFVINMIEDQINSSSVLSFLSSTGDTLTINETGNGGKREDGLYYSNTYSFNPTHREPKTTPTNYYYGGTRVPANPTKNASNHSYTLPMVRNTGYTKFTRMTNIPENMLAMMDDATISRISKSPPHAEALIKELLELRHDAEKARDMYKKQYKSMKTKQEKKDG